MKPTVWVLTDGAIAIGYMKPAPAWSFFPIGLNGDRLNTLEAASMVLEGHCPFGHGPLDRERGNLPIGDVRATMARCRDCCAYFRVEMIV